MNRSPVFEGKTAHEQSPMGQRTPGNQGEEVRHAQIQARGRSRREQ